MAHNRLDQLKEAIRKRVHDDYQSSLADGRRQRAATFKPGKGKGSYRRRPKHAKGGDQ